jgi:hypothetical protein
MARNVSRNNFDSAVDTLVENGRLLELSELKGLAGKCDNGISESLGKAIEEIANSTANAFVFNREHRALSSFVRRRQDAASEREITRCMRTARAYLDGVAGAKLPKPKMARPPSRAEGAAARARASV